MAKEDLSLSCLVPLLGTTLVAIFWCAVFGPQLWLVVLELTGVVCPVLWHLPTLIRLSCKVLVVLVGGIAISLGVVIASQRWLRNVDWSVFLIMPSVTTPITSPPLTTLSIAVAWPVTAVFCFLWLRATSKKLPVTPVTSVLPVTITPGESVQALWREMKDLRAQIEGLRRPLTRVTAVQQVEAAGAPDTAPTPPAAPNATVEDTATGQTSDNERRESVASAGSGPRIRPAARRPKDPGQCPNCRKVVADLQRHVCHAVPISTPTSSATRLTAVTTLGPRGQRTVYRQRAVPQRYKKVWRELLQATRDLEL
eukprot:Blabericola_migrator_1__3109@NODE_1904_length_3582_cov_10_117781_g1218_i0_p1_GENE_NODE_1904_length_3582_cov_10_117781_g1218_i0NODE_1904_length_3582_cov_10_117781_g1218_i0_p1_ORF_typecomplete_len311_score20_99NUDE_C/PF04880_13/0_23DUF2207/PF09972_9/0_47_NODE_1904_length_3582_cov_10_117781_g1218_i09261858